MSLIEDFKQEAKKEIKYSYPSDLVDDWKDYISEENKGLTTGIKSFDEDLRFRLRGKVGAYIGYGGTKKSLLALQSLILSVRDYGARGLYSTMEMPSVQLLERIIDYVVEVNDKPHINSSWYLEKHADEKVFEMMKSKLGAYFGKSLAITQHSRMKVEDYDDIIKRYESENGKLDLLIVDGLSMMGSNGGETESYTTNSGELKDLAKDHNIYIPLICHLSKGAEKHTREVQRFVRGSEKILDNVDFVIQMSLILENTIDGHVSYKEDEGWVRMYNKRGSGKTIDKIYTFDKYKLHMTESDKEPYIEQNKTGF